MTAGIIEWTCRICQKVTVWGHQNPTLPPLLSLSGLCKEHAAERRAWLALQEEKEEKERKRREIEAKKRVQEQEKIAQSRCVYCSYQFQESDAFYYHPELANRYYCVSCDYQIDQLSQVVANFVDKINELPQWELNQDYSHKATKLEYQKYEINEKLEEIAQFQNELKEIKDLTAKLGFRKWTNETAKEIEKYLNDCVSQLIELNSKINEEIAQEKIKQNSQENQNSSNQRTKVKEESSYQINEPYPKETLLDQIRERNYQNFKTRINKGEIFEDSNINSWEMEPNKKTELKKLNDENKIQRKNNNLTFSQKTKNAWDKKEGKILLISCGIFFLICLTGLIWTIFKRKENHEKNL